MLKKSFQTKILTGWFLAMVLLPGLTPAHAPEKHQFRLTAFRPPITAPAFTLETPVGGNISLADFQGRVVLLNFWATWCPPCVREMPSMEKLYQAYRDRNFAVLAVSLDQGGKTKVVPFLKKVGVSFPVALDPNIEVADVYGARDLPSSFLIDPQGRVIAAAKGERDWFSPEARSYLEEVLGAWEPGGSSMAKSTAEK